MLTGEMLHSSRRRKTRPHTTKSRGGKHDVLTVNLLVEEHERVGASKEARGGAIPDYEHRLAVVVHF